MRRKLLVALGIVALALAVLERRALAQVAGGPFAFVDLVRLVGAVPSASNPFPTRESDGSGFVDPREIEGQNNGRPIYCTSTARLNMTTATTTEIVALSGSTHVYVCSYSFHVSAAADVKLVSGTGTNCATSAADITANWDFAAADAGVNRTSGGGSIVAKTNDAGDAVCAVSSASVDVDVEVSYAQF